MSSNSKPTRYAANLQISQTPDSVIALGDGDVTITIRDTTEVPVEITLQDAVVEEGGTLRFDLDFSAPLEVDTTINFAVRFGTAETGDINQTSGSVHLSAGSSSGAIFVETSRDADVTDEAIFVDLAGIAGAGPSGISVGRASATGSILDIDVMGPVTPEIDQDAPETDDISTEVISTDPSNILAAELQDLDSRLDFVGGALEIGGVLYATELVDLQKAVSDVKAADGRFYVGRLLDGSSAAVPKDMVLDALYDDIRVKSSLLRMVDAAGKASPPVVGAIAETYAALPDGISEDELTSLVNSIGSDLLAGAAVSAGAFLLFGTPVGWAGIAVTAGGILVASVLGDVIEDTGVVEAVFNWFLHGPSQYVVVQEGSHANTTAAVIFEVPEEEIVTVTAPGTVAGSTDSVNFDVPASEASRYFDDLGIKIFSSNGSLLYDGGVVGRGGSPYLYIDDNETENGGSVSQGVSSTTADDSIEGEPSTVSPIAVPAPEPEPVPEPAPVVATELVARSAEFDIATELNGEDSHGMSWKATTSRPDYESVNVGGWGASAWLFSQFDIPELEDGAMATGMKLIVDVLDEGTWKRSGTIRVERVTNDWDDTTLNWANKPGSTDGFDIHVASGAHELEIDLSTFQEFWAANPDQNFGIVIKNLTTDQEANGIATVDHSDASMRPRLIVDYEIEQEVADDPAPEPEPVPEPAPVVATEIEPVASGTLSSNTGGWEAVTNLSTAASMKDGVHEVVSGHLYDHILSNHISALDFSRQAGPSSLTATVDGVVDGTTNSNDVYFVLVAADLGSDGFTLDDLGSVDRTTILSDQITFNGLVAGDTIEFNLNQVGRDHLAADGDLAIVTSHFVNGDAPQGAAGRWTQVGLVLTDVELNSGVSDSLDLIL